MRSFQFRVKANKAQERELNAVEFYTVTALMAQNARTRQAREALLAMHPWDGRGGIRRLRQRELHRLWEYETAALPIVAFDEALDELLNPAGWLLAEHWRQLREGMKALSILLKSASANEDCELADTQVGVHLEIDPLKVTAAILPDSSPIAQKLIKIFTEEGELDPFRVPALVSLHHERSHRFAAVQNKLEKLLAAHSEAIQDSGIVERNGRYCLPVRTDRKGSVPGLVLDRSSSGATLFVEPFETVPLNNDFVEADRAYLQALQAFLRDLLEELRRRREDFIAWQRFQGEVDEILALLRWQALCEGNLPILGERFSLQEARHPLLLPAVRSALELAPLDHDVVPLTLELDPDKPGLVISGSNTGGKTVVMKTAGLLASLSQAGCAIPAKAGTELPKLVTLHADIGDHQTLVGSLSTFSSHIVHLREIIAKAKSGGLVLLDELGTGTDPKEGAALGVAVLQILSQRHCWVLCSTHLGEISQWALGHKTFQNASVQFDEERLAPTYKLMVGQPGQSRALTIAAKLGLPRTVLEQAERFLGKREQDWREFLRQLEADRLRLMEEREELARQQALLERDRLLLGQREEKQKLQQEKCMRENREKLTRAMDFIEHESKRLVKELKEKQKLSESMDRKSADRVGTEASDRVKTIGQIAWMEVENRNPTPVKIEPSDIKLDGYARHRGLGLEGKVVSVRGDRAVLQTDQGRRLEARVGELESIHRADMNTRSCKGNTRLRLNSSQGETECELNLIGRASDDIDMEVHRFIEEALSSGLKFIRIVHGHGTGKLKAAVREALKGHPGICRVEDAPQGQGGAGATLITLR